MIANKSQYNGFPEDTLMLVTLGQIVRLTIEII